jgi:hypothetical protein
MMLSVMPAGCCVSSSITPSCDGCLQSVRSRHIPLWKQTPLWRQALFRTLPQKPQRRHPSHPNRLPSRQTSPANGR